MLLLLLSSVSDWLHSLYIDAHRGERSAKVALVSSIIVNLLMLGFFKYADFIIETVNVCLGIQIPTLGIPLPIGISFFTFQTMSYTIDVYRGRAKLQRNFATFATYVCLFPQLIAGPIVRYTDVERELADRESTLSGVTDGIIKFCVGLGKKVLIANLLGEFCTHFTNSPD
ncbi:MAG: MBOAT family protein, partial [Ruminococcaceae bacterium]|nr:MBOAT family protein [Oscillospiraceae bacterium]